MGGVVAVGVSPDPKGPPRRVCVRPGMIVGVPVGLMTPKPVGPGVWVAGVVGLAWGVWVSQSYSSSPPQAARARAIINTRPMRYFIYLLSSISSIVTRTYLPGW